MIMCFSKITVTPFLKEIGCYVDTDDSHAFMFSPEGKLTFIKGEQAFTQALVRNATL